MALMAVMMVQWCGKVQYPPKHGNMVCGVWWCLLLCHGDMCHTSTATKHPQPRGMTPAWTSYCPQTLSNLALSLSACANSSSARCSARGWSIVEASPKANIDPSLPLTRRKSSVTTELRAEWV